MNMKRMLIWGTGIAVAMSALAGNFTSNSSGGIAMAMLAPAGNNSSDGTTANYTADFAYPVNVANDAAKMLKTAKSGAERLQALMLMTFADDARNNASMQASAERVLEYEAIEKDQATQSMMNLFAADIYYNIYNRSSYIYDKRDIALTPRPDNVALWSTPMFSVVVDSLINRAWELSSPSMKIDNFKALTTLNSTTSIIYPRVRDFIAAYSENRAQSFSDLKDCALKISRQALDGLSEGSVPYIYRELKTLKLNDTPKEKLIAREFEIYDAAESDYNRSFTAYLIINDKNDGLISLDDVDKSGVKYENRYNAMVDRCVKYDTPFKMNIVQAQNIIYRGRVKMDKIPTFVVANKPFDFSLSYKNISRFDWACYRFDTPDECRKTWYETKGRKVDKRASFTIERDSVWHNDTRSFELSHGEWLIKPTIDDNEDSAIYPFITACTVFPFVFPYEDYLTILVLDAESGKPRANLPVNLTDSEGNISFGKTNAKGYVSKKDKSERGSSSNVIIDADGQKQWFDEIYLQYTRKINNEGSISTHLATSLSLYHPGDSVKVVGVLTSHDKVVKDQPVTLTFYDTKNKEIAKASCVSDDMGRVSAEFKIPDEMERYGDCRIKASCPTKEHIFDDYVYFSVNDFKMPEFEIKGLKTYNGTPSGQATLRGNIATFAGAPMSGVSISCLNSTTKQTYETTTDQSGDFEIVIPAEGFKISNKVSGLGSANLTVSATSRSGYTVTQDISARNLYPNSLSISTKKATIETSTPTEFDIEYVDTDKVAVDEDLTWTLTNRSDSVVMSGTTRAPKLTVDFANVEPGVYTFTAEPVSKNAQSRSVNITLYNTNIDRFPCDIFWLPETNLTAKNGEAEAKIFIAEPGQYVNVTKLGVGSIDKSLTTTFMTAGWHTLSIPVSAKCKDDQVLVFAMRNAKYEVSELSFKEEEDTNALKIEIESFRHEINSASSEDWTMKVTDHKGRGTRSALWLNIFNKQLDKVSAYSPLSVRFYSNKLSSIYYLNYISSRDRNWSYDKPLSDILLEDFSAPAWNSLGYTGYNPRYNSSVRPLNSAIRIRGYASEVAATNAYAASADSGPVESKEDETEVEAEETWRDPEVSSALWMPILNTDSKGAAHIAFTAPDYNSTWLINAEAWTADGKRGSYAGEITTTKPVIVDSYTPRFLRHLDSAIINSAVYNNSDIDRDIQVVAEVRDDANTLIAENRMLIKMKAHSDTIISTGVNVPDTKALTYSVRATADKFTDGERAEINVASSQSRVSDVDNFYLNSSDTNFTTAIPESRGTDFDCRLMFTANPMATVLDAVPSVTTLQYPTSTVRSACYYMSTIALALMEQHPELAERLNKAELQDVAKKSLANLIELQTADGGIKWAPWSQQSSPWATSSVLTLLGWMKHNGYLPDDSKVSTLINKALEYLDANALRINEYEYTLARSFYDSEPTTIEGKSIKSETVQKILANWKYQSPSDKALDAIVLQLNNNKAMAKTLLGSLSQFATKTKNHGIVFKNASGLYSYGQILEAYGMILPESEEVDGLRQHLLIEKQAADWGSYPITTKVITSMLNSGTKWAGNANDVKILVDGKAIEGLEAKGNVQVMDSIKLEGKELKIERPATSPAYGAIVSTYTAPTIDIKSYSDGEISIEKTLLVLRDDKTWSVITDSTPIHVGDRVKVQLSVKSSRNLSYLTITDERPAALEPVVQLSGYKYEDGVRSYRENRDRVTNLYIDYLREGTAILTYEFNASHAGTFASGVATVTSDMAPTLTAHSSASTLRVE
jgi:hypothetical protein